MELFAGPLALDTWLELLADQFVIHFVDNSAALGALVKGYSPSGGMLVLSGDYWLRCAHLRSFNFIDRVESKSNLSDEPSRPDIVNIVLDTFGARFVPPCLSYLNAGLGRERPAIWLGGSARRLEVLAKLREQFFSHRTHRTTVQGDMEKLLGESKGS